MARYCAIMGVWALRSILVGAAGVGTGQLSGPAGHRQKWLDLPMMGGLKMAPSPKEITMDHAHHTHHHAGHAGAQPSLNAVALRATIHCLSGCAVGEVLGMVIG